MCDYIPPNKKKRSAPHTCPKCGSDIRLVTTYSGYDMEEIDPKTGKFIDDADVYTERTDVHDVQWSCSMCTWEAAAKEIW